MPRASSLVDVSSMDGFNFIGVYVILFEVLSPLILKWFDLFCIVDYSSMPRISSMMDGLSIESFIFVDIKMDLL